MEETLASQAWLFWHRQSTGRVVSGEPSQTLTCNLFGNAQDLQRKKMRYLIWSCWHCYSQVAPGRLPRSSQVSLFR